MNLSCTTRLSSKVPLEGAVITVITPPEVGELLSKKRELFIEVVEKNMYSAPCTII